MELVRSAIPPESVASRASRLGTILMQMAATGLTGGHVMDGDVDSLDLLATLEEANRLPLRLRLAPWCRPEDGETRREELVALQTRGGRLWKVAAVKLFMDGTIDGGTAWLDEPDTHGESRTSYWSDPEEFTRALHYFAHLGVQTATHAIGDAAVAHVLASLESLEDRKGVMHRVEHLETLPDHLIQSSARWESPRRCSRLTAPTFPSPTTVTTGPGGWATTGLTGPGDVGTCSTPAPP